MPMASDRRARESREALDGVRRDSEALGASSLAHLARRAGEHFSGQDAVREAGEGGADPIELWGRRIGRALSVVLAFVLTGWLGLQLGWW